MSANSKPQTAAALLGGEIRIGSRLRRMRKRRGMTLRMLGAEVGCSESMISKIENDKAEPSLTMLHRIVLALETNIATLFDGGDDEADTVMRAGRRPIIETGSGRSGKGVLLERLIPTDANRMLQANIHVVPAGGGSEGTFEHEGEEMGYVLDGTVELTIGDRTYLLQKGDSFLFRSECAHGYFNSGSRTARVLWVNTPPTF